MVTVGLLVRLEARPGKENDVASFLEGGLAVVQGEPETITWYAIRLGPSTFGIFDTFPDDSGRQAHLSGQVAAALMEKADELFAEAPASRGLTSWRRSFLSRTGRVEESVLPRGRFFPRATAAMVLDLEVVAEAAPQHVT